MVWLALQLVVAGACRSKTEGDKRGGVEEGPSAARSELGAGRAASGEKTFLYVRIPEKIMPIDRGAKYEDPLDEFLQAKHLGEVTGGGTMMAEGGEIEYVGIDVDVYDPEAAIPLIISRLKELGVPAGTVIEQYEPVRRDIAVE